MELSIVWFILLGVLFSGFFFLEGFDYGVGILLPFLGKNDRERRMLINSIGPVWNGNEVWMITAGGAMFAAFPHVYATLFSGLYLALFLMLVALILRGVAVEYRNKGESQAWRNNWDWLISAGSLIPALLWGVAVTNLIQGVPIDAQKHYVGSFFDLLSPYTLTGGLAFLLVFIYHGAVYLTLKTEGEMAERARMTALKMGVLTAVFCLILLGLTHIATDLFSKLGAGISFYLAIAAFVSSYLLVYKKQYGWAFITGGLSIICVTVAYFWGLFPRLIVSSLNPAWSLTVNNASSSPYTLKLMTITALVLVPVILAYQGWAYWVFRKGMGDKEFEY